MIKKSKINPAVIWMIAAVLLGSQGHTLAAAPPANTPRSANAPAPDESRRQRPNILFVIADDHANAAISAYGSDINQTPNIDRLAREGMLFQNCLVTNSICTPARATLLTGKYSHANGTFDVGDWFDGSQPTFPKMLQKVGYQTAIVGKWHLASPPTGFDYWNILFALGFYYNPMMNDNGNAVHYTGYTTKVLTDLTLDWLKNKRDPDKPFMMVYSHKAPHREWKPGPGYFDMYDGQTIPEPPTLFDDHAGLSDAAKQADMRIADKLNDRDLKFVAPPTLTPMQRKMWDEAYGPKNRAFREAHLTGKDLVRWKYQRYIKDYLRTVASVDDQLGRVLKYLDDSGLAKNTVVVYSSDQGMFLGEHGWFDKRFMYEPSLRTPLIVRWPGKVKPESEDKHMVLNIDFAETFLDIAGVKPAPGMQGRSFMPLLKGEDPPGWRQEMYYHYYEYPAFHRVRQHYGIRDQRYKLIHYYTINEWEFFDLDHDPLELKSEYDDPKYAGVIDRLKKQMHAMQQEYGDTMPNAPLPEVRQLWASGRAKSIETKEVVALPDSGQPVPSVLLQPLGKPITVGAWCTPEAKDGVLIAQGGQIQGYALYMKDGRPHFAIRSNNKLMEVVGDHALPLHHRAHVVGMLTPAGKLRLFINGNPVAQAEGQFITQQPEDPLSIGRDVASSVGDYSGPLPFEGAMQGIRVYWGRPSDEVMGDWLKK